MLRKWWHSVIGEPVIVVDGIGDIRKTRLKRIGPLLRINKYGNWFFTDKNDWITVNADGTINNSYLVVWHYRNSTLPYNPQGILDSILKTKEILPVLMGINPDLDKLIERELKS
jgi:hypothetical protein